jgi:hypothetical protein
MSSKTYWTVVSTSVPGALYALVLNAEYQKGYVDAVTGTGELHGQWVPRFESRKAAREYAKVRRDELPGARVYRLGPARENKTWIVVRTDEFGDRLGAWSGAEHFGSEAIVEQPKLNISAGRIRSGDVAVFNSRKQARAFREYRERTEMYPQFKYTVESVDV